MTKQNKYRILCTLDDVWMVQERMGDGSWMSVHHCELKAEQGYYEAKAWIKRKEGDK